MASPTVIDENILQLRQGSDLIARLTDPLYQTTVGPCFNTGVGMHFRHILDYYTCFLAGIDRSIDYDARERNELLSRDRSRAMGKIRRTIDELDLLRFQSELLESRVLIRDNERDDGTGKAPPCHSTVGRELKFLLSHTVHHFAIIAMMLRIQGFEPFEEFGLAASTIECRRRYAVK